VSNRMSPVASMLWDMNQETGMRMTVGSLLVLDRSVDVSALTERLSVAAERAPVLRQHPDRPPGVRTRLSWTADEQFDAGTHLIRMAVAPPGDLRQVLDLVALVEKSPFDPERSPWDVTVIDGMDRGRSAVYLRAHHCLTDGLHGTSLVRSLFDEAAPSPHVGDVSDPAWPATDAPDGSNAEQLEHARVEHARVEQARVEQARLEHARVEEARIITTSLGSGRRRPGTVSVTVDLAGAVHPIATTLTAARRIDPLDVVVRGVQRGLDVASSVSRQAVVTGGPLSPLSPSRSLSTRFEAFAVPGARATALALGGSRNDLLVAAAARGLGLYHERLGISVSEVRLASPARWSTGAEAGGSVVPARVEIPVSNAHPGPLFGVVAERLARARREPAVRMTEMLASVASRLPHRLLMPAMRAQAASIDFVATTLPGARGVRHLCGAVVETSFPFGPRLGSLMNATAFGVGDRLDVGIALDPVAIAEPDVLVECVHEAFNSFAGTHGA
jgi:diacylglycerol O-acyltransferase